MPKTATTRQRKGSPARDKLGPLPEWDLSDLYPSSDGPEITRDIAASGKAAQKFAKRYQGKLSDIDGDTLAKAIADYEKIDEVLSRVMSYASLLYAADMMDPENGRFYQSMQETVTGISSHVLFFALELNRIPERILSKKLKASAKLRRYEPWLRDSRAYRPYQLGRSARETCCTKSGLPDALPGIVSSMRRWPN